MTGQRKQLYKWNRSTAAIKADIEAIARARITEYHNTAVSAQSAEIHALNGKIEYLVDVVSGLTQGLVDAHNEINGLKSQLQRAVRTQGSTPQPMIEHRVETTTVTETIKIFGDEQMQKEYRKGVNINWKSEIPPVNIAFNEFDLYRRDNNLRGMISPLDVKANWSTLFLHSKKLTGMTMSRLLKTYADERKLNYAAYGRVIEDDEEV